MRTPHRITLSELDECVDKGFISIASSYSEYSNKKIIYTTKDREYVVTNRGEEVYRGRSGSNAAKVYNDLP